MTIDRPLVAFDFRTLAPAEAYKLMIGSIVPRPIAWVSTVSAAGKPNLAPFSFFNGVSSRPPCVMVAITRNPDGSKKDTLRNLEETGELVIHSVEESLEVAQAMNLTSGEFAYGVDEFEKAGLIKIPSLRVKPPRVQGAKIQMECSVHRLIEIGDGGVGSSVMVIAQIELLHCDPQVLKDGRIDAAQLSSLSRLGGPYYGKTREIFSLARPSKA